MPKISSLIATLLLVVSTISYATTWVTEKVRDPIANARINVSQPASSGGYIYQWPEKSDQVFWPYTDDNWLWFNPKSGYIAFGGDFEEIDSVQRDTLKAWLKANFDRKVLPKSRLELLAWAEKVYAVRGMDDDFWCYFYRLMAYETKTGIDTSLGYVRKAIPLLIKRLELVTKQNQRMETLYLLSEYHRRIGNVADSVTYLDQLTATEVKDDLSGFKTYLLDIVREQRDPSFNSSLQRS